MSYEVREFRRIAGMFAARLPDLKPEKMEDPRWRRGRRWSLAIIVRTVVVGMAAGCQSVAELESLTERMSGAARRMLGIKRKLPDTTTREVLVRLDPYEVRQSLRYLIQAAHRRGALKLDGLPFHVLAMDGKVTKIENWDHHYSQQQVFDDGQRAHGLVRTVTACLTSTAAKPILDAFPIPAETNEMGIFGHAFESLLRGYGSMFQLVTYDAGVPSEDNCKLVVDAGKNFSFQIKNENWFYHQEAVRRLGSRPLSAAEDVSKHLLAKDTERTVVRSVFTCKAPESSRAWGSVKSLIRVNVRTIEKGQLIHEENKFYISSLAPDRLTGAQWNRVTRGHWGVENNGHWTLDAIFKEDERPWFQTSPRGVVVVMVLRRIAYTMLALFRGVTLRSEENRAMAWRRLMRWVGDMLIAATTEHLADLRRRVELSAVS